MNTRTRVAELNDLDALVALEQRCFSNDRISRRSFRHFLEKSAQSCLLVIGEQPVAYLLLLFRRGTSLARIYSLAVDPAHRGGGLARELMTQAQAVARQRDTLFLRLEVAAGNHSALGLYKSLGYRPIKHLAGYYESGDDAVQMEKRLNRDLAKTGRTQFYAQSTEFTCGPAAAIMAMGQLRPDARYGQIDEINLWRESTTVFMTQGHGGCSPHGLALALANRGFATQLWQSTDDTPFLRSVRNEQKREIIELVHQSFLRQLTEKKVPVQIRPINTDALRRALTEGFKVLLLISTYQLNRNKAPHWVWLTEIDSGFAYINDPDVDHTDHQSSLDNIHLPIALTKLNQLLGYGANTYRAAVLLKRPN